MIPPDTPEVREAWREALDTFLARRERTAALRRELLATRALAKQRRHTERLRRARVGNTTPTATGEPA